MLSAFKNTEAKLCCVNYVNSVNCFGDFGGTILGIPTQLSEALVKLGVQKGLPSKPNATKLHSGGFWIAPKQKHWKYFRGTSGV